VRRTFEECGVLSFSDKRSRLSTVSLVQRHDIIKNAWRENNMPIDPTFIPDSSSSNNQSPDTQQGEWSHEASPYTNGPYVVLSDGSTFDGADGCAVVYVTDSAEEELRACSDFKAVEDDEMEVVTLSDLLEAYNQVHGTDL
jgi:hypothetical protein